MIKYVPHIKNLDSGNFFLIAGPCVVESENLIEETAAELVKITKRLKIPFIFKASYKKANRTSSDSFSGIGDKKALAILSKTGKKFKIPIITDIHTAEEARLAAKYVDVLQIPAFLCRQTELLVAAAKTGKPINIKKGQFLAPHAMRFAVEKVMQAGNDKVWLTERGTTFGYRDLVVDFRSIPIMKTFQVPIILDCTHSLQQPNQPGGVTGGQPELIAAIAKAGIAVGADGLFMEVHPEPLQAKSDAANMLKLDNLEELLKELVKIRKALR